MKSIVSELKPLLEREGYEYREHEHSLFIALPNNFGELEIADLEENDDIIGLVGEQWHTHSSCLENENLSPAEKIIQFLRDIKNRRYLLIKEQEPGKDAVKIIEDDLESYKKYLPARTTYAIYNET